jgi:flagellar FliL protein
MASDSHDLLPPPPKKKESPILLIGAMLGLTVAAAAAGTFAGSRLTAIAKTPVEVSKADAPPPPKYTDGTALQELPPVITALAEPSDTWIRLQGAIIYDTKDAPKPEVMAAEIADDTLSYLKTLSAAQIAGPSGLLHLREDLSERARIRSDGRIREFMIETMVVQ